MATSGQGERGGRRSGRGLSVVGGMLLASAALLPIVSVPLVGGISLLQLGQLDPRSSAVPAIVILAGVAGALAQLAPATFAGASSLVISLLAAAAALEAQSSLGRAGRSTTTALFHYGIVHLAFGAYVGIAGIALCLVGGIRSLSSAKLPDVYPTPPRPQGVAQPGRWEAPPQSWGPPAQQPAEPSEHPERHE